MAVFAGVAVALLSIAGKPYVALAGPLVALASYSFKDSDPYISVAWSAPVLSSTLAYSAFYEAAGPAGAGGAWAAYLAGGVLGFTGFMLAEVSYLARALEYGVSVEQIRVDIALAYYLSRWGLLALGLSLAPLVDVVGFFLLLGGLVGFSEHIMVQRGLASKL